MDLKGQIDPDNWRSG